MGRLVVIAAAALLTGSGCASDADATGREVEAMAGAGGDMMPVDTQECMGGQTRACDCAPGSGTQMCSFGSWGNCMCAAASVDGGTATRPARNVDCDPGLYLGTYTCMYSDKDLLAPILLEGAVQFDLEVNETEVENQNCDEFCADLVISEGSGELFGFALLLIGFESKLSGGLDCSTGEFRANAVDGIWGIPTPSDPNDPNSPAMVAQPPSGTFDGTLTGEHTANGVQTIAGDWSLMEIMRMGTCPGPFSVELQP